MNQMLIFTLLVSAGVLFDSAFSLWVSLKKFLKVFWCFYLPFVMHVCSLYERRKKEDGRTGHHSLKRVDAQIIQYSMTKSLWNKIISVLQQVIKPFFIHNLEISSCITNKLCHSYLSKFIIALSLKLNVFFMLN